MEEDGALFILYREDGGFISSELTRIRHTSVICREVFQESFTFQPKQKFSGNGGICSLDSVLALAFRASRSSLVGLIEGESVRQWKNGSI